MTVPSETSKSGPYFGNNVTKLFDYGFKIVDKTHIQVIRTEGDVPTVLVVDIDYIVSGVGNEGGGQIETAVAPTGVPLQSIMLLRNVPFTQETDLENQGAYYAETVEEALDLATMRDQQLSERLSRALVIPPYSDPSELDGLVSDILRLKDSADNIDIVANNIDAVENASDHMADILAAPGAAAAAAGSASDASDDKDAAVAAKDDAIAAKDAAVAAKEAAEAAAEGVTLPAVTANTMLVDNAAGTLRETKTFPQVRALLEVPKISELPWYIAAEYGVPGDGTDQTAALQAIIDGLPAEGGNVLIKGNVNWTQLSAADRRNIRFIGLGGLGAGAQQNTRFRCIAGALGNGVSAFNLKRTMNVSFEKMFIDNRDAAFTGTLLDWGDLTSGSALMSMIDCYLNVLSNVSGARGINLYGATQGVFDRVKFAGARILVQMQNASGVGWCNQHTFRACSFNPSGSSSPIIGSGEGITFQGCNVQASSGDGIGRFWSTDLTQPFRGVNLISNTFYDVLTTGGVWANFYTGQGLNIIGNMIGGAANVTAGNNYGMLIGGGTAGVSGAPLGVAGGQIVGNSGRYMSTIFGFAGTKANYNNVRSMLIGGNFAYGSLTPSGATALYSSIAETENILWMPSEQNAAPFAFGTHLNMLGLPAYADNTAAYAAGMQGGDIYRNTSTGALTLIT